MKNLFAKNSESFFISLIVFKAKIYVKLAYDAEITQLLLLFTNVPL